MTDDKQDGLEAPKKRETLNGLEAPKKRETLRRMFVGALAATNNPLLNAAANPSAISLTSIPQPALNKAGSKLWELGNGIIPTLKLFSKDEDGLFEKTIVDYNENERNDSSFYLGQLILFSKEVTFISMTKQFNEETGLDLWKELAKPENREPTSPFYKSLEYYLIDTLGNRNDDGVKNSINHHLSLFEELPDLDVEDAYQNLNSRKDVLVEQGKEFGVDKEVEKLLEYLLTNDLDTENPAVRLAHSWAMLAHDHFNPHGFKDISDIIKEGFTLEAKLRDPEGFNNRRQKVLKEMTSQATSTPPSDESLQVPNTGNATGINPTRVASAALSALPSNPEPDDKQQAVKTDDTSPKSIAVSTAQLEHDGTQKGAGTDIEKN